MRSAVVIVPALALAVAAQHAAGGVCDGHGTTVGPVPVSSQTDAWAAPASYYAGVSGTGTALRTSLQLAMSTGHIQRSYGDFRNSAALHDADPDAAGRILLVYNVASVSATWDSGGTWNREHIWPVSRQPGSASNSSRGNLGDPHALRPCNPSINGSRSNKPFGTGSTTGGYRSLGTYWFPGDTDKGLIARSIFYSSVRYGLQLVDGLPSGNQMGDLAAMVAWHYQEEPSEFERRRNHIIYAQARNPAFYTNNRNAFVDLPGAVWAVFRDNLNDSQLWVGDAPGADGGSTLDLCQRVIVGTDPEGVEVMLHRGGQDGVYYAVIPSGAAITDQPLTNGFTAAFAINETAPRPLIVGIDPSVISGAGLYTGDVWIDNLDMTDGLGAGFGSLDADDLVMVSAEVNEPSIASFDAGAVDQAVTIDFGLVPLGNDATISFPVHALESVPGFTAGFTLSLLDATGDTGLFVLVLPDGVIGAGGGGGGSAEIDLTVIPTDQAAYAATYELLASDDPAIAGAADRSVLTITALATAGCPGDVNGDGLTDVADLSVVLDSFTQTVPPGTSGDVNGDGIVDSADLSVVVGAFGCG